MIYDASHLGVEQQSQTGQRLDVAHDQEIVVHHQSSGNIDIDTDRTECGSAHIDHMHVERVHEQIEGPASCAQQTEMVWALDTVIHNVEAV